MEEVDLKELLLILRRKLWIILLITILFTSTSGLISYYVLQPEYETYTTLMIGRPKEYNQEMKYDDVLLNQKLVSTYSEIAKSRAVANEFISNLGLQLTYEEWNKKINVKLVEDTEIIKIIVRDREKENAAKYANEIATIFIKHVARIMNIENIQVIDKAEVPLSPSKPRPLVNMVVSAILGMLFSMLAVFIHEYLDNKIKTSADIEKYLGLPVIGLIPKIT